MDESFPSTQWSLIVAARDPSAPDSRKALSALCETYWQPIYTFIRHRGHDADAARDLTQAFFAHILDTDFLKHAQPERGRFRSFLLASVKNMLADTQRRALSLKRGAGRVPISLDADAAERGFAVVAAESRTPEALFEQSWALTVLQQALHRLAEESSQSGKMRQFEHLKPFLTGEKPAPAYRQVAADLEMTADAVKMAVHRLRKRFGEVLRAEVTETVATPRAVDDEVRYLLSVLRD